MRASGPLHRWINQHPSNIELRVARSVQLGQQLYRRWLVVRAVTAVAIGIGTLALAAELRTDGSSAAVADRTTCGAAFLRNAPLTVTADGASSVPAAGVPIVNYRFDFDPIDDPTCSSGLVAVEILR